MTDSRFLGPAILLLGIICVSSMDALAKLASSEISVIQVTWSRFTFHFLLLTPFALMSRQWRDTQIFPVRWNALGLHIMRGFLLVGASISFFLAIRDNPVPDSLAVFFIEPLIVMIMARFFLSEAFDKRLLFAAFFGLIGVLIVLRPGGESVYSWTIVFALLAAVFFAGYIVLARFASLNSTALITSWATAGFGLLPMIFIVFFQWKAPDSLYLWSLLIAIGVLSGLGHTLIILACRFISASRISILHYTEVGVATIINWLIFRHFPDVWVWCGIVVIAMANLYVLRVKHE